MASIMGKLFGGSTKTKTSPWAPAAQFLTGANGHTSLLQEMENNYLQNRDTVNPAMQGIQQYQQLLEQRMSDPSFNEATHGGINAMRGAYNTNFGPVAGIQGAGIDGVNNVNAQRVRAGQTNLTNARQGQGVLDPTSAMGRLLSGRPDTQYLDQQANAIQRNAARNLMENVMPGLRSEAVVSGQYGGSRQGLAEGLAMSRLNQDLAPSITGMYSNALENAQGRMAGTASELNQQAYQNAANNIDRRLNAAQFNAGNNLQAQQFNANNALNTQQFNANKAQDTQQFNANLGLQNNQFGLQQANQNLNNFGQGLNFLGAGLGLQDQNMSNYINTLKMPQDLRQENIDEYARLVMQAAGLGGTTKTTKSPGIIPAAAGVAATIAGAMTGKPSAISAGANSLADMGK